VTWQIYFTKQAQRDAKKISAGGLRSKAEELLNTLCYNLFHTLPIYEKLTGDL